MERTILIANTSNMPPLPREASIYTGITMAEYFMTRATTPPSWLSDLAVAEALASCRGRMEEMPPRKGSLPICRPNGRVLRAGRLDGGPLRRNGSVSIIAGPPAAIRAGTQHTKRFIRCRALDRTRPPRHYPAISWLTATASTSGTPAGGSRRSAPQWLADRTDHGAVHREVRLQQVVKLVGPDALPDTQRFILEVCTLFKNAFLQQNAYDQIDAYSTVQKQAKMMHIIALYWQRGSEALKNGATLMQLKKMKVYQDIIKMKFSVPNDDLSGLTRSNAPGACDGSDGGPACLTPRTAACCPAVSTSASTRSTARLSSSARPIRWATELIECVDKDGHVRLGIVPNRPPPPWWPRCSKRTSD